jgi:hypothetical protein
MMCWSVVRVICFARKLVVSLYTCDLISPVFDWDDIPLQTHRTDQIFAVNFLKY